MGEFTSKEIETMEQSQKVFNMFVYSFQKEKTQNNILERRTAGYEHEQLAPWKIKVGNLDIENYNEFWRSVIWINSKLDKLRNLWMER